MIKKLCSLIFLSLLMISSVFANERPTIQFAGKTYYLERSYNEVDYQHSPVNVVEFYLPVGETSDNYKSYIQRVTMLQVNDYKTSAKSQLHEILEDNKNLPYELIETDDGKKMVLNITFWWPFRPSLISKRIYVFQKDDKINRVMYYLVGEEDYHNASEISDADLVKKGKSLLLDNKLVDEAKKLSF